MAQRVQAATQLPRDDQQGAYVQPKDSLYQNGVTPDEEVRRIVPGDLRPGALAICTKWPSSEQPKPPESISDLIDHRAGQLPVDVDWPRRLNGAEPGHSRIAIRPAR